MGAGASAVVAGGAMLLRPGSVIVEYPHGAPQAVSLAGIAPGTLRTVEWRGMPVWVLHRSAAMLEALGNGTAPLRDAESVESLQPATCRNATRALLPQWFVAVGLCTHQGCTPQLTGLDGFLCPCHASRYDLAGRVHASGPALRNLVIPAYRLDGPDTLVIGAEG
jgi:ubiquinol-cytochrome c reductase iron-sulfur subunit